MASRFCTYVKHLHDSTAVLRGFYEESVPHRHKVMSQPSHSEMDYM